MACDDGNPNSEYDQIQLNCSCQGVVFVSGCTSLFACNFNPLAVIEDLSCVFPGDPCDDGNSNTPFDIYDENCECIGLESVSGCTDSSACNWMATATENDGSCAYPGTPVMTATRIRSTTLGIPTAGVRVQKNQMTTARLTLMGMPASALAFMQTIGPESVNFECTHWAIRLSRRTGTPHPTVTLSIRQLLVWDQATGPWKSMTLTEMGKDKAVTTSHNA